VYMSVCNGRFDHWRCGRLARGDALAPAHTHAGDMADTQLTGVRFSARD
jgi:hypothetical protein